MPSELYVQVPLRYGDFAYAVSGSPLDRLSEYGREASFLLQLHLRMVMYSREYRLDGLLHDGHARHLARWAGNTSARTAKRDLKRLEDAGFIERRDDGWFVPAAVEWPLVRKGTRDHISDFIRDHVYERDGYRCVLCGATDDLTLDHIIPWSKGGPDTAGNLQTLCGSCNSRKKARIAPPVTLANR